MRTVVILIERVEKIHVLLLNLKIKNTCIGSNTLRAGGFWNYGDTLLNSPAKSDLSRRMCIFRTKYAEDIIVQISASRQWSISLYLDPVCLAVFNELPRIAERMAFDLVDCRNDPGYLTKFFKNIWASFLSFS